MQPKAKNPKRAEALIAVMMLVGVAGLVGFGVAYIMVTPDWVYGLTLGIGTL